MLLTSHLRQAFHHEEGCHWQIIEIVGVLQSWLDIGALLPRQLSILCVHQDHRIQLGSVQYLQVRVCPSAFKMLAITFDRLIELHHIEDKLPALSHC